MKLKRLKGFGDTEALAHILIFFFAAIIIVALILWFAITRFRILG